MGINNFNVRLFLYDNKPRKLDKTYEAVQKPNANTYYSFTITRRHDHLFELEFLTSMGKAMMEKAKKFYIRENEVIIGEAEIEN